MGRLMVLALRGVIVALGAGSLFVQTWMVPILGRNMADAGAAMWAVRVPCLVIVVLGFGTAEVVMVCVWRLVTMVRRGTVFSHAAFRFVDVVMWSFGAAAVLLFALGFVLAPGGTPPGVVLLIGGAGLAVLGVALIVLVLGTLLAQAVARDVEAQRLRAELAEVI